MDADVIVVGAGYSGLAAARTLTRAGVDAVVVEASARIGGRAQTERSGAAPVDLGGQWIGPGQTRITAHAQELGLATYASHSTGTDILVDRAEVQRVTRLTMVLFAPAIITAVPAIIQLHRWITRGVDGGSDAGGLDQKPISEWMRERIPSARLRRIIAAVVRDVFCREPGDVSMLALVTAVRGAGGLGAMVGFDGGSQQDLFIDGADRIPHLWARDLEVRTEAPVVAIGTGSTGARVRLAGGATLAAKEVIVAVPPAQARKIAFEPGLSPRRRHLLDTLVMGRVVKAFAVYDRPFWRDLGLSGSILMTGGPASLVADVSPPHGPGHLCILAAGRDGDRLAALPAEARRRTMLHVLERAFGARAGEPVRWIEKIWMDDPWIGGGYAAVPPVGGLGPAHPEAVDPASRLAWAGTDMSVEWWGYFEGAVRAGERAAAEVLGRI